MNSVSQGLNDLQKIFVSIISAVTLFLLSLGLSKAYDSFTLIKKTESKEVTTDVSGMGSVMNGLLAVPLIRSRCQYE